jgi:hypothetical protein
MCGPLTTDLLANKLVRHIGEVHVNSDYPEQTHSPLQAGAQSNALEAQACHQGVRYCEPTPSAATR